MNCFQQIPESRGALHNPCGGADSISIEQFVCMGHSVGTSWSQQIAAALPQRVRGIFLLASMADPRHPEADLALRLAVTTNLSRTAARAALQTHGVTRSRGYAAACRDTSWSLVGLEGNSEGIKVEANYKVPGLEGVKNFHGPLLGGVHG